MAICTSCSAPLPASTFICSYCGTRNDMDFAGDRFTVDCQPSRRDCPDCAVPLQTISIDTGAGAFAIERCDQCYGLFFDAGEVQAFLEASVSPAFAVNLREIVHINEDRSTFRKPVRYIRCPDCGGLMNRVNYGAMSGVVVDCCKDHGVWLDNGELIHLMEWKKAGGQLLKEKAERPLQPVSREGRPRPAMALPEIIPAEPESATELVATTCLGLLKTLFQ
jgi:Zn-finger nucleic acid-binding protein